MKFDRGNLAMVDGMAGNFSKGPEGVLRLPCWGRTQVREI